MRSSQYIKKFLNSDRSVGIVLMIATILSLLLANLPGGQAYTGFWETRLGAHTITEWINDALMPVFFLHIGLELKRELLQGELSDTKTAVFPAIAALGGMIVPACIYLLFNYGGAAQGGAGIPMATDIAFALGVLSLIGKRIPAALSVFLMALAVIDDLGAIMVIAVFYTKTISGAHLLAAGGILAALFVCNRLQIRRLGVYLAGGVALWYFMLHSGVHATIAGVLLALVIPSEKNGVASPAGWLEHALHKPVSFAILPLFALANTCIGLENTGAGDLFRTSSLGIAGGLLLGKPLGIVLFSVLGVATGACRLPKGIGWRHIAGVGCLAGIGFTMSIFITLLAFEDAALVVNSKMAILAASALAGIVGSVWLMMFLPKNRMV